MSTKRNRTQQEIDDDNTSLMFIIEQLNMDNCYDTCIEHNCHHCVGL